LGRERGSALAAGDTRRAAELAHRGDRVRDEIDREQEALNAAQRAAGEHGQGQRQTGEVHTRERRDAHGRFLDEQAALPASGRAQRDGERRDYAALAGLAGYGREEYAALDPRRQRAARLEVDRELALRRELGETARTLASGAETARVGRRERRKAGGRFDGALQRRMQDAGHSLPESRTKRSRLDAWLQDGRADVSARAQPSGPDASTASSVMHDAREVAARRKRQLGRDRP
jgi:hypothetical protein